jgi:hypothetical protein
MCCARSTPGAMAAKYWTCSCGTRNERIKQRCPNCARKRPKRRVPAHARTLRDDSYQSYGEVSEAIHGVTDESCCVCGRPRHELMHHHRDHDHVTGLPRGIVCFQCNGLMPRLLTLDRARLIVGYLERCEAFYGAPVASQEAS